MFTTLNLYAVDLAMCGPKPSTFSSLFTDASKIRIKCINDAYDKEKRDRDQEVEKLTEIQKKLDLDIKKVAFKSTLTMLFCDNPEHTWPKNKIDECHKLNEQRNAILSRIEHLQGWDETLKSSVKTDAIKVNNEALDLPCPTDEELSKIQGIRYFDRKAYKTWERCVNLR